MAMRWQPGVILRTFRNQVPIRIQSRSFAVIPQVNPQTGEVFKEYTTHTKEEVSSILTASDTAFREWKGIPTEKRCETLGALAEILRSKAEEAAALIQKEMGKPLPQGVGEVNKCAMLVDWYAKHGPAALSDTTHPTLPGMTKTFVTYQPLGVILSVMPWNFPFWQVIRMSVPTMMAGNTVVLKHARNCFGSALFIEDIFAQLPGLPKDAFRTVIIPGGEVDQVIQNPLVRGGALTGSCEVGRAFAGKMGSMLKKCVVELGGSDGYVILADADVDSAAKAIVAGRILNTGQSCISPKRVLVDKSIKANLEKAIVDEVSTKKYGVDWGPLVDAKAAKEVARMVSDTQKAGATLLCGGADTAVPEGDSGKAFYPPTVLTDVKPGSVAFDEEIFGPVITIVEAQDEQDAVKLANDCEFGLGGAVFTGDVAKGERLATEEIEAGMCFVNDFVRSDPSVPFGGTKNSGLGRECSTFGLMEFVNVKTISVK
mmetsp:Transcript_54024/g.94871  ORF Transcript_54024/g.94871 Transcript_54024/m.94871 type:complete len:485 (+) Transcript_54024:78-1532(+)